MPEFGNPSSKKIHQASEISNRAIGIINSGTNRNKKGMKPMHLPSNSNLEEDDQSVSSISKLWKGMNCQGTNNMHLQGIDKNQIVSGNDINRAIANV